MLHVTFCSVILPLLIIELRRQLVWVLAGQTIATGTALGNSATRMRNAQKCSLATHAMSAHSAPQPGNNRQRAHLYFVLAYAEVIREDARLEEAFVRADSQLGSERARVRASSERTRADQRLLENEAAAVSAIETHFGLCVMRLCLREAQRPNVHSALITTTVCCLQQRVTQMAKSIS
jgi:hypothetical protein